MHGSSCYWRRLDATLANYSVTGGCDAHGRIAARDRRRKSNFVHAGDAARAPCGTLSMHSTRGNRRVTTITVVGDAALRGCLLHLDLTNPRVDTLVTI